MCQFCLWLIHMLVLDWQTRLYSSKTWAFVQLKSKYIYYCIWLTCLHSKVWTFDSKKIFEKFNNVLKKWDIFRRKFSHIKINLEFGLQYLLFVEVNFQFCDQVSVWIYCLVFIATVSSISTVVNLPIAFLRPSGHFLKFDEWMDSTKKKYP